MDQATAREALARQRKETADNGLLRNAITLQLQLKIIF